ncbi:MAG: hypothetical protein ORN54_15080 [Cyclobacteriaceae bacterium]|nr:hypothetical protein [Cyclobacteriaceae bacterium]
MGIAEDLKKLLEHGDWLKIASLYNQSHQKPVSSSYVLRVVNGERAARPGTAAHSILELTEKYLTNRKDFNAKIISEA